ncbi:YcxB family protein [Streptomyces sp. NPDC096040]|uniref:YcxB family protein n=1 Tax=Streptomyces sp. NPDC096040 TaxID=3155541 RepID=UPI0033280758
MVMDMNVGRNAAPDTVELEFVPTARDFTAVWRQRRRFSKGGRREYWMIVVASVVAALQAVLLVTGRQANVGLLAGLVAFVALLLALPWLTGRAVQRMAARNGVFRTVVTASGVTVTTDHTSTTIDWVAQPRYNETPELFITFSDTKGGLAFTLLPKRGLPDPADADRLRAILDRHLTRG